MQLLKKLFSRGSKKTLEIISVHVPKTAGTSFRQVLEHLYGNALQPIYTPEEGNSDIWQDRLPPIPEPTRAIHGHFPATKAMCERYPKARLVAWVRDPVQRMISFFNHWCRTGNPANPNYAYFVKNKCTIVEFAGLDFMKNEMLGYLNRVPLESFAFIGIMEQFDTDIQRLADIMHWDLPDLPRTNITHGKQIPSKNEILAMQEVMREEIEFYDHVRRMRDK